MGYYQPKSVRKSANSPNRGGFGVGIVDNRSGIDPGRVHLLRGGVFSRNEPW